MRRWPRICASVLLLLCSAVTAAQTFPSKPIRIVVAYPPGGGSDIMARTLAEPLHELLGQPVIIDNKPGAGGAIGAAEVARAPADGYTLLFTAGSFVIAPAVLANPGYDPAKDFVGVAQVAIVPLLVLTRPESPLHTFADLLALAKYPNVAVKVSSLPSFSTQPFPFPNLHRHIRAIYDAFGSQRMIWGSDVTRLTCRYDENIRLFSDALDFLSDEDKEWIFWRSLSEWCDVKL